MKEGGPFVGAGALYELEKDLDVGAFGGLPPLPGGQELGCNAWLLLEHPLSPPLTSPAHPMQLPGDFRAFSSRVLEAKATTVTQPGSLISRAGAAPGALIPAQRRVVCTKSIFILLLLPVSCRGAALPCQRDGSELVVGFRGCWGASRLCLRRLGL